MANTNSPDSSYFRIERKPAKRAGPSWRATASLFRKDTDELVDEVRVKDASREAAEERLTVALATILATLQRPDDWGKDATVAHVLQRYLRMRDQLYGKVLRAETTAQPEASILKSDAEAYERAELMALSEQVAAMNEQQLLELAGLTNEQRALRDNPATLDILTAKKRLSELIPNPSSRVQAAYNDLVRALNE